MISIAPGTLVKIVNAVGLELDGCLFEANNAKAMVVHVHGSLGNFYQNKFLHAMAEAYKNAGAQLLSVNMTAHDSIAEGYYSGGRMEYVGGSIADFQTCVEDIRAIVAWARQRLNTVVLQGHSLGCDRVIQYMLSHNDQVPYVLLSPCDSHALQLQWLRGEAVESQVRRLRTGPVSTRLEWLEESEYGVRGGADWTYPIPITRDALLSILEGPPMRLFRLHDGARFTITTPGLIYLGGQDRLQTAPPEQVITELRGRLLGAEWLHAPDGDHSLGGVEAVIARKIANWIASRVLRKAGAVTDGSEK